ncbi:MAG: hypothetical protein R3D70_00780 [Rhizobiaceae bacterium]
MSAPFPIPHMSQGPHDDLAHVLSLLEVMSWTFDSAVQHGMSSDAASSLYAVLCDVQNDLKPVMVFLDALNYDDLIPEYRKARRQVIEASYRPFADDDKPIRMTGGQRNV